MLIKGIIDEDFVNFRVPTMTINTNVCSFKCDAESGRSVCHNSGLARSPSIDVSYADIAKRYAENKITKAICIAGLEPFDQWKDLFSLLTTIRVQCGIVDTVVIYTGYTEHEISHYISILKEYFQNIIVKFGRFIPDEEKHFDEVLGVYLASPNQYAKKIC